MGYEASKTKQMEGHSEQILFAALRYKGEIFTGINHDGALTNLRFTYPDYQIQEVEQGYSTSKDRFVSKEEAVEIVKNYADE